MENIWDGGVSNTIGSGTVKLFHSLKFSVENFKNCCPNMSRSHDRFNAHFTPV